MTSVQDINDTWFDEINCIVATTVSCIFNLELIVALSRVKIYSESAKRMQIFGCALRLLFSSSVILSSPTLAYITEAEAVYIVKGGFKLPMAFGTAMLITFVTFVIFSCMGPPMQFLQVVCIVKNSRFLSHILPLTTTASFVVSLIATVLLYVGYTPDISDDQLSQDIVYNLNGKGEAPYLIASLERYDYALDDFVADPTSWVCTLYILAVLVMSTVVSVVCWLIIRCQKGRGSKSSNTIKTEQQLTTVLIVQFTVPFLTIHIPFYVSFLMPLFRVATAHISTYLPYLFAWCPALSPIVVLIMIKSIREKMLFFKSKSANNSSANVAVRPRTGGWT